MIQTQVSLEHGKVLPFPSIAPQFPISAKLRQDGLLLDRDSKYPCNFDYSIYEGFERRYADRKINGGIVFKSPLRLPNAHPTCQQCLYAFEVDTYGRGCTHECSYCYAKAELTVHGMWNNPVPMPADINELRRTFYTVFETDRRSKWRSVMERRIPLRIGSMSDSFMHMDRKYKVTQELLKLLSFYEYPYLIFTRSDLVAADDYVKLLRRDLCAVQMSISSVNDDLNRKIEPGAPTAARRLAALQKLSMEGFWTTVRVNPLFPTRPDGFFTDPDFKWDGEVPKFDYSTVDLVDAVADHKVPALLVGFARLSSFGLNNIERATGINLRPFFDKEKVCKSPRDWHYSDREINHYYNEWTLQCLKRRVQFSTCYIGNGEGHFWNFQDKWSNKADCCNVKNRVAAFHSDAREIAFSDRLKHMPGKKFEPLSTRLHEPLGRPREVHVQTPQLSQ